MNANLLAFDPKSASKNGVGVAVPVATLSV
jgi:hypothetical protein